MDMNFITELYIPVVMAACLVAGYILKKWAPGDNKWIPTVLVALGSALGCISLGISLESVVSGAVTGLASTGLHQVFKQLLNLETGKGEEAAEALIQAELDAAEKECMEAVNVEVEKAD